MQRKFSEPFIINLNEIVFNSNDLQNSVTIKGIIQSFEKCPKYDINAIIYSGFFLAKTENILQCSRKFFICQSSTLKKKYKYIFLNKKLPCYINRNFTINDLLN